VGDCGLKFQEDFIWGCQSPELRGLSTVTGMPQSEALVTGKPVIVFCCKTLVTGAKITNRTINGTYMEIPPELIFCVYILLSEKDGNFYVGITTDLSRRLDEHNQGRNTSTASRRPFRLIHAELYSSKEDALRRETYLKTAKGRRVIKLMLADTLGVTPVELTPSNM